MALRSAPLRLLVLLAVALRDSCVGASSHSMKYFYTAISEPSQGQPHFVTVGYVNDQIFSYYDSNSRREQPRVSWMEKAGKEDPQYWDRNTQKEHGNEESFREGLETLRSRYNQSEGLHTWQLMCGCELRRDGRKGGFIQYGYEGRTFLTFDKETLTWVAPDPQAQITQRKWDALPGKNQRDNAYLEEECIEWLEKHLSYGNETLLRRGRSKHFAPPQLFDLGLNGILVLTFIILLIISYKQTIGWEGCSTHLPRKPPVVTMSSRTEVEDGMEMHVCRVHGFYPREIDASWMRNGEVWEAETFHTSVAPNADGTYHYWLSVRIDPKERGRYRCHVEHDGLQDPLDLELKEPTDSKSKLGLIIIGCVVGVLVLGCVIAGIAGIVVFFRRRQDGYKAASRSNQAI